MYINFPPMLQNSFPTFWAFILLINGFVVCHRQVPVCIRVDDLQMYNNRMRQYKCHTLAGKDQGLAYQLRLLWHWHPWIVLMQHCHCVFDQWMWCIDITTMQRVVTNSNFNLRFCLLDIFNLYSEPNAITVLCNVSAVS